MDYRYQQLAMDNEKYILPDDQCGEAPEEAKRIFAEDNEEGIPSAIGKSPTLGWFVMQSGQGPMFAWIENDPFKIPLRKEIEDLYDGEELLFADGFDEAIIGVSDPCPGREATVVYNYGKCVQILQERDGMNEEDAIEHMGFNVVGGWHGNNTPTFIHVYG